MNPFTFNPEDKQPIYQQLYRHIIAEIAAGRLAEGEKLPSKRALATHLRVSVTTVESAYTMLVTEGYLFAKPKSGYYVAQMEQPLHVKQMSAVHHDPQKKLAEKAYRCHFRTNAVDTTLFPYSTWAKMHKEVLYTQKELLNHGDVQGDALLRETLCKYLHEVRGVNCSPEQMVIGAGLEYLIGLLCTLFDSHSVFALENPGYPKVRQIISNHDRLTRMIPVGSAGMEIAALVASNADVAYVTPSHQFPTGVTMPIPARMKLLSWAHGTPGHYIIEDDYDSEFRYIGRPIPSLQGLDSQGRVIYTGTFSRSLAPSIRIAYMILPQTMLERFRQRCSLYSSTVSRFEQHTLARFIAQGQFTRHLNRVRSLYRRRKDYMVAALRASPLAGHITIDGENAGLHFLLKVHGLGDERMLLKRAAAAGIRVHGLSDYADGSWSNREATLVLGYAGMSETEIDQAVRLLAQALVS